jgi:hypothetical protein
MSTTTQADQLAHLLNGAALTLAMRLNRLADEWRQRDCLGQPPHPAMLSEQMDTDELTAATATIARALADAVEREHADRERERLEVLHAQERRQAELLRKYPPAKPTASKRPAAEMVG